MIFDFVSILLIASTLLFLGWMYGAALWGWISGRLRRNDVADESSPWLKDFYNRVEQARRTGGRT